MGKIEELDKLLDATLKEAGNKDPERTAQFIKEEEIQEKSEQKEVEELESRD